LRFASGDFCLAACRADDTLRGCRTRVHFKWGGGVVGLQKAGVLFRKVCFS
jgi:hypothetical protein